MNQKPGNGDSHDCPSTRMNTNEASESIDENYLITYVIDEANYASS